MPDWFPPEAVPILILPPTYDPTNLDIHYFHDFCKAYRESRNIAYPDEDNMEASGQKEKEEILKDKLKNNLS